MKEADEKALLEQLKQVGDDHPRTAYGFRLGFQAGLQHRDKQAEPVANLDEYDAGCLNDYGGGNVGWWHDYIRAELGRAYEYYQSQLPPAQPVQPVEPVAEVVAGVQQNGCQSVTTLNRGHFLPIGSRLYSEPPADVVQELVEVLRIAGGSIMEICKERDVPIPHSTMRRIDGALKSAKEQGL